MLSTLSHQLMYFFFPAAMAAAAAMDLVTMTIPNRLSAALAVGYFILAIVMGVGPHDIALHAACGLAILIFAFALFSFRWIGGGDAKLAAATALWLGWTPLADYGLASALTGGALTVVILLARRLALPPFLASQAWIARLHDAKNGVPYGIALALGGLFAYPETPFWALLAAR